ncbi:C40 family peptidase [Clostridioides difficile]|uniref:C40 family peptidase n=1 Tax=Clostridioides difficile TaxID=1496 RepID=UPI000D1D8569|nr:C40 family peptidase [Clostridioides difficile]HBE9444557.1 C40 family peptidase [Clostridioides difficile]
MKNKKLLILSIFSFLALSVPSYAEETKYNIATVKDGLVLNVRDSKDNIIYKAKAGEELKVKDYSKDRIEVETKNNATGYINSKYVDVTEGKLYVKVDSINMRADNNVNSKIQLELKKGDSVILLDKIGEWLKIRKGDKEGYIKEKYLEDKDDYLNNALNNDIKVISMGKENILDQDYIKNIEKHNAKVEEYVRKLESENSRYITDGLPNNNFTDIQQVPHADKQAAQKLLDLVYQKQGCPYVWGAEGDDTFDCSGLTMWAYKNALNITIPRVSRDQADIGNEVDRDSLEPGDLVFFATGESRSRISHVGIYVGQGKMIHAPHTGSFVKVQDITTSFYKDRFIKAVRLI